MPEPEQRPAEKLKVVVTDIDLPFSDILAVITRWTVAFMLVQLFVGLPIGVLLYFLLIG